MSTVEPKATNDKRDSSLGNLKIVAIGPEALGVELFESPAGKLYATAAALLLIAHVQ
jgi:hypothetical protein